MADYSNIISVSLKKTQSPDNQFALITLLKGI